MKRVFALDGVSVVLDIKVSELDAEKLTTLLLLKSGDAVVNVGFFSVTLCVKLTFEFKLFHSEIEVPEVVIELVTLASNQKTGFEPTPPGKLITLSTPVIDIPEVSQAKPLPRLGKL